MADQGCGPGSSLEPLTDATASLSELRLDKDRAPLLGDPCTSPTAFQPMPFSPPQHPSAPDPVESRPGEGDPRVPSPVIPVVAAVIRRGDRCLLAQRQAGKRHGGSWEFPGGKVGDGESEGVALARELREELGVTLAEMGPCLFTAGDPGTSFRIRFWASRVEGEPQPLEHAQLRWVTPAEARALRLAPADARFLREGMDGWEGLGR